MLNLLDLVITKQPLLNKVRFRPELFVADPLPKSR
jgi:hypothetical protein